MHCDIKPENVLLSYATADFWRLENIDPCDGVEENKRVLKLGDLGVAWYDCTVVFPTQCVAPQRCRRKRDSAALQTR